MNQDRFYVYILKTSANTLHRVWTDNLGVRNILNRWGGKDDITVVKTLTNQCATLLGDDVVWIDIGEESIDSWL